MNFNHQLIAINTTYFMLESVCFLLFCVFFNLYSSVQSQIHSEGEFRSVF